MNNWSAEQFAYFVKTRERLRPKFVWRGLGDEYLEHYLDVAAIDVMQQKGVI